jgi:hypothetical protein
MVMMMMRRRLRKEEMVLSVESTQCRSFCDDNDRMKNSRKIITMNKAQEGRTVRSEKKTTVFRDLRDIFDLIGPTMSNNSSRHSSRFQ